MKKLFVFANLCIMFLLLNVGTLFSKPSTEKIINQIIVYPKHPPIKESIKFGNKSISRLGSKDFKKPIAIKGYVNSFGIIKCFRSIKKITR